MCPVTYIFFVLLVNKIILDKEYNQFFRLMNKKKNEVQKEKKGKIYLILATVCLTICSLHPHCCRDTNTTIAFF